MARGEIRYTLSADGTPMRTELSKAESDLKKWQGLVGRVSRDIEGSEQRVAKEIAAVGAAVKKMGGEAQLSEPQLKRVADRLADLEAKGGKIPAHLRAIADRFKDASGGAAGLSQSLASIKDEKLAELAGQAGFAGRALSAMGPAGIAAAAALAITVGAATAVAGTLATSTKEAISFSGRITDMSEATGIGTDALQRFDFMAKQSGGSTEAIAAAAMKLKTSLVEAPQKFDQLGLSAAKLRNLAPEEQLRAVGLALKGIENPTLRDAAAMDVLGRKASEIFAILKTDPAKVTAEMERLGLALSTGTIAALDNVGDSAAVLTGTWEALWRQLGGAIGSAPALKQVFDDLATLVGKVTVAVRDAAPEIRAIAEGGFVFLRDAIRGVNTVLGDLAAAGVTTALREIGSALQYIGKWALTQIPGGTLLSLLAMVGRFSPPNSPVPLKSPATAPMDMLSSIAGGKFAGQVPGGAPNLTYEQVKAMIAAEKAAAKAAEDAAERARAAWQKAAEDAAKAWGDFRDKLIAMRMGDEKALLDAMRQRNSSALPYIEAAALASIPTRLQTQVDPFDRTKPKQYNLGFSGVLGTQPNTAADPVIKSSFDVSQALQNLANVASLSGSKLAKGLAGVLGGGAGIGSAISGLKSMSGMSGLTGILGKAGMWGQIGASVISIGSSLFSMFKKKPKPPPEPPPPPKEHVNVDAGTLATGIGGAFKGVVATTGADAAAQARILSVSFWQVFTEQGLVAAATSFKDVFTSLNARLGELGGDAIAEAVLGPIGSIMDKMDNEQFRGAAEGAQQYSAVLKEMRTKEVPLTIDQFQAFEQQLASAKAQAEAGGATTKESFAVIAPYLQEIIQTAAQYGFAIDENTQKLIDQAKAAGMAFPTDPVDRLIAKLDEFFSKLLGIDGKQFNVGINANYTKSGSIAAPGGEVDLPGFARGTGGLIDFGAESVVALHGREAVLTERQYSDIRSRTTAPAPPVRDDPSMPQTPIVIHNYLSLNDEVLGKTVATVLERGGPGGVAIRTALDGR